MQHEIFKASLYNVPTHLFRFLSIDLNGPKLTGAMVKDGSVDNSVSGTKGDS